MKNRAVLLSVLFGLCAGCRENRAPASVESIERFGLEESAIDHPLVSEAIAIAAKVSSRSGVAFAEGWRTPSTGAVPVFAASGAGLSEGEIMTTYAECRCVIVQAAALPRWLQKKQGSGKTLLSVDAPLLLSYMLLHEAGHIARGHVFQSSPQSAGPDRGNERESQKSMEIVADEFAANAITTALAENGTDAGLAAARVAVAIAQLSWNLAGHRLLDDFGGTFLRKPSLFQDAGFSHPNLEWRVLRVNALVSPNSAARSLLEEFEDARNAGPAYRLLP
jgi:hypothetical protein